MDVFLYIVGGFFVFLGFYSGLTYDSPYEFVNDIVRISYISSGITAGIFFFWMGNVTQHLRDIKELMVKKEETTEDDG